MDRFVLITAFAVLGAVKDEKEADTHTRKRHTWGQLQHAGEWNHTHLSTVRLGY